MSRLFAVLLLSVNMVGVAQAAPNNKPESSPAGMYDGYPAWAQRAFESGN